MVFFPQKTLRCFVLAFAMDSMMNKTYLEQIWLFTILLNLTGKNYCEYQERGNAGTQFLTTPAHMRIDLA